MREWTASGDSGSCDSILDLHPEHLLFGENSVSSSRNDPSEPDFEGELPMKFAPTILTAPRELRLGVCVWGGEWATECCAHEGRSVDIGRRYRLVNGCPCRYW